MSNYSQETIANAALKVITLQEGISTSELISVLRNELRPDGTDVRKLKGRKDDVFSQKVRNLKSHGVLEGVVRTEGTRNSRWYMKDQD